MSRQQSAEVLTRLEGGDRQQVRTAEVLPRPVGAEAWLDAGVCDPHPISRDAEQPDDLALRELGVREDDVAGARGVPVLRSVHPACPRLHPLRKAERNEVVDHRRPDAAALGRIHPVGEVQDVDRAEEPLDGRPAKPAPSLPPEVREGEEPEPQVDGNPLDCPRDRVQTLRARRREGDDLVLVSGRVNEAGERAADVVADARPRVGERRDVEGDPHYGL